MLLYFKVFISAWFNLQGHLKDTGVGALNRNNQDKKRLDKLRNGWRGLREQLKEREKEREGEREKERDVCKGYLCTLHYRFLQLVEQVL